MTTKKNHGAPRYRLNRVFTPFFLMLMVEGQKHGTMGGIYDTLSAVRGCDVTPSGPDSWKAHTAINVIKEIVTGRIRAIVFVQGVSHGAIVTRGTLTPSDVVKVRDAISRATASVNIGHYLMHLREAVVATGKHEIWGGLYKSLFEALGS